MNRKNTDEESLEKNKQWSDWIMRGGRGRRRSMRRIKRRRRKRSERRKKIFRFAGEVDLMWGPTSLQTDYKIRRYKNYKRRAQVGLGTDIYVKKTKVMVA